MFYLRFAVPTIDNFVWVLHRFVPCPHQQVANGGARLKPLSAEVVTPQSAEGPIQGTTLGAGGSAISTGPAGDSKISPGQDGNLQIENKKMTMARFGEFIGRYGEIPVVDLTGIKGVYEMESMSRTRGCATPRELAASPSLRLPAATGETPPTPPGIPGLQVAVK
jgi:uncharacterized protein (TIGR03435 family)